MITTATLLLLVVACLTTTQAAPHAEKSKEVTSCQAELGVTDAEVEKYMDKDVAYPEKMKCFCKCLAEKHGYVKNDQLDVDKMLSNLKKNSKTPEQIEGLTQQVLECSKKKGTSVCDTAYEIYKCLTTDR